MKISQLIKIIIRANKVNSELKKFNDDLREKYHTTELDIFHQASDGWVLLYNDEYNVPLSEVIDKLLDFDNYEELCEYCDRYSI